MRYGNGDLLVGTNFQHRRFVHVDAGRFEIVFYRVELVRRCCCAGEGRTKLQLTHLRTNVESIVHRGVAVAGWRVVLMVLCESVWRRLADGCRGFRNTSPVLTTTAVSGDTAGTGTLLRCCTTVNAS